MTLKSSCYCLLHPGSVGITIMCHHAHFPPRVLKMLSKHSINRTASIAWANVSCPTSFQWLILKSSELQKNLTFGPEHEIIWQYLCPQSNGQDGKTRYYSHELLLTCTFCFLENSGLVLISCNLVHSPACLYHAPGTLECKLLPCSRHAGVQAGSFQCPAFQSPSFFSGSLLWFCKVAGNIDSQNELWLIV